MEEKIRNDLPNTMELVHNISTQTYPYKGGTITLNVGGRVFMVLKTTLKRFPDSKLAWLNEKSDSYSAELGAYFFDRNPVVFESILEACRTGELHVPRDMCGSLIKLELEFWEISPACLSPCCWKTFYRAEADLRTVATLSEFYEKANNIKMKFSDKCSMRSKLWLFLDEPRSSKYAMVWAVFMTVVVVAATFVLTSENATGFLVGPLDTGEKGAINYYLKQAELYNSTDMDISDMYKYPHPALKITEIVCYCFITIDITLRLLVCPSRCKYLSSPIHICEIAAVIGDWFDLWIDANLENLECETGFYLSYAVKFLLIFQSIRLFRMARHIMTFNIMRLSVASSMSEIGVLVSLLLILTTVFGWLMYLAEMTTDRFQSIFDAMYWSLITLTTVGYGDLFPDTIFGHVVACACAVCGIVILALPIGVIAANFNTYYNDHKYVYKHIPKIIVTKVRLMGTADGDCSGQYKKPANAERNTIILPWDILI